MRIGINLLPFAPGLSGGIGLYACELVDTLCEIDSENEYFLFTNSQNCEKFQPGRSNVQSLRLPVRARPQLWRILWEQLTLPVLSRRLRLDVLHSPGYVSPIFATGPTVVTICDMLYRAHPEFVGRAKLAYWRLFVPLSAKRARRVLTISEYSKRDIVQYLDIPPEKVVVTPLAVHERRRYSGTDDDVKRVCAKYGVKDPFILSVGAVGPHKNPLMLVRALGRLHQGAMSTDLSLVIVGNDYGARIEIEREAESLGIANRVQLLGFVHDEDLSALYRAAAVYVTVSRFEGFGLTVLEAMACETPVVASDRCSLPEVVGDAGVIVALGDVDGLASAIKRVVSDRDFREDLVNRSRTHLQRFSWKRTAEVTLEAYRAAHLDLQGGAK